MKKLILPLLVLIIVLVHVVIMVVQVNPIQKKKQNHIN